MTITENKKTLAAVLDNIWSKGDVASVDRYVHPTYTIFHDPGDPFDGQTLDLDGYKHRLITSRHPFPDQAFTVVDMIGEGDKVATSWTWQATHMADFPGFPASKKPVKMSGLTIYSFKDGKVCGHWQMVNRLGVYQQLQANAEHLQPGK
ncbi:hypothetical protein GCM10017044_13540 [Kordiimonas sediminis]|uniref:Ester cyclase n=1 Tax=Kordiimonas sediminis TaxID=1735581 RepID=A0A919AQV2_9PROT|nr:ester cyclase [Kordiimonas sediminis]GHF20048.1 hypothetical protein GCM10017044_13540 [Kordiimonas sediminis]